MIGVAGLERLKFPRLLVVRLGSEPVAPEDLVAFSQIEEGAAGRGDDEALHGLIRCHANVVSDL